MTSNTILQVVVALLAVLFWQWRSFCQSVQLPRVPSDPQMAAMSETFEQMILQTTKTDHEDDSTTRTTMMRMTIKNRGMFAWDEATVFWNRFTDNFAGPNPNTPYMYSVLPLFRWIFPLPSPMWRLTHNEAVVLLAKTPPKVEYFSITTFCLLSWKRGLLFSSLGDSINSHNIHSSEPSTPFAHVVVTEHSPDILETVQQALTQSGLDPNAIHVAVVPAKLIDEDRWAFFEVVMRIFRFENQTQGDAYLDSHHQVFHIQGTSSSQQHPKKDDMAAAAEEQQKSLAKPTYKDRSHPENVNEYRLLAEEFAAYQQDILSSIQQSYHNNDDDTNKMKVQSIPFGPLKIRGLDCVDDHSQCLGDCPDAVYFGSNILNHDSKNESIRTLQLLHQDELHLAVLVDHRHTNASIYSNVALLTNPKGAILNKTHMDIRGTSVGVLTNHEFHIKDSETEDDNHYDPRFFSWIFTRNPDHCTISALSSSPEQHVRKVNGCTVIPKEEVPRDAYLAYCERIYLNPVTATGPDWADVIPAKIYHIQNVLPTESRKQELTQKSLREVQKRNQALFSQIRLPDSVPLKVFQGEEKLRFLHIVKTGGESLENYLGFSYEQVFENSGRADDVIPQLDYGACRQAAFTNITTSRTAVASSSCWALSTFTSTLLCSLNCECCAADMYSSGRFHGTLLRSPRSHLLSLFIHGHSAHHTTWERMAADKTLYLAEGVLRMNEYVCGHSGTNGVANWKVALEHNLQTSLSSWPQPSNKDSDSSSDGNAGSVQVISLRNTQAHTMTCGKRTKGSLGQHFRVTDDEEPDLEDALQALYQMEWIGITDLFHPSLCLLHYQANQTLPLACDCNHKEHHTKDSTQKPLGHWAEYRTQQKITEDLSPHVLEMMDAHTTVDSKLFVVALRLFLGRLRKVEEITNVPILECIDWNKLRQKTEYIPGLWTGGPDSLLQE